MTTHTPGPWTVDDCLYGQHNDERPIWAERPDAEEDELIAMVPESETAERRDANARLIAASPALLEVVRQAAMLTTVVGTDAWGLKTIAAALLATLDEAQS